MQKESLVTLTAADADAGVDADVNAYADVDDDAILGIDTVTEEQH